MHNKFLELEFDQSNGIEVLQAQLESLFDCEVLLLDFAGRRISVDGDIEDIKVVEISESGDAHHPSTRPSTFSPRPGALSTSDRTETASESKSEDENLELIPALRPEGRGSVRSSNVMVITNAVADVWCVEAHWGKIDYCCSAELFPSSTESGVENRQPSDGSIIQPRYRVVDTDILVCAHCQALLDPSLVVCEPTRLTAFVCQISKVYSNDRPSNQERSIPIDIRGPVGMFLKRSYLHAAIEMQPASVALAAAQPSSEGGDYAARVESMISTQEALSTEKELQSRLQSGMRTVLAFEDQVQQDSARKAVDLAKIREYSLEHLKSRESGDIPEDVAFLIGLLRWFKQDFFSWVHKPQCHRCQAPTTMTSQGVTEPSIEEKEVGNAGRTELYRCEECEQITRFPRFNKPSHLLTTRRGRCGEFANAFCLICRSVSLDTRWVLDFTDHVWAEVWVPSWGRYVHLDPCENILDSPLMYEQGWGKQLTYVFSFSRHGVVDATSRYSRKLAEVLIRRNSISEKFVRGCVEACDAELEAWFAESKSRLPNSLASTSSLQYLGQDLSNFKELAMKDNSIVTIKRRKRLLAKKLLGVQLETKHIWKIEELQGRISGDRSWREDRGEIGSGGSIGTTSSTVEPYPNDAVTLVSLGGGVHPDTIPFDGCSVLWADLAARASTGPSTLGELWASFSISEISVWSSSFVNGFQCRYYLGDSEELLPPVVLAEHDTPTCESISLAKGETVRSVRIRYGAIVDSIRVVTSLDRVLQAGGEGGEAIKEYVVPAEWKFVGFFGGKGGHIHNLGVIIAKNSL